MNASALINKATAHAGRQHEAVTAAVRDLAEAMRDIHGGEWLVSIDHEGAAVILYRAMDEERAGRPERGEMAS